ncbi:MAG: hypothetical protein DRI34_10165 [Deltaproteobacteria bacterium]|nr:MAG: hypothetical protein DRI34_10165 [Deltaproteobacteria bacterium]
MLLLVLLPAIAGGREREASLPGWPRKDAGKLTRLLEGVDLRKPLGACLGRYRQAGGHLTMTFVLHLAGGASGYTLSGSDGQTTNLAACLVRVVQDVFGDGQATSPVVPARLELTIPLARWQDFSYRLAVPLAESRPVQLPGFTSAGAWRRDSCPVGRARLRLEATDLFLPALEEPEPEVPEAPAVAACLKILDQHASGRSRRRHPRRRACACLAARLEKAPLAEMVAVADMLVKLRCRRQRRRLTAQLEQLAGRLDAPCNGQAGDRLQSRSATLLELSDRHLRLRGFLPLPVVETLAERGCPRERRALFSRIFSRRPYLFRRVEHLLLGNGSVEVRLRAAQNSCLFSRSNLPEVFTGMLADGRAENRALAVLYAPACLHNLLQRRPNLLAGEHDDVVLALALRAAGLSPRGELLQRARRLLGNRCPAVRFLGGEVLARVRDVDAELLQEQLRREGDPWLRRRLEELRAGRRPPSPAVVRLWLEWPDDRQAQMELNSSSPNRSR